MSKESSGKRVLKKREKIYLRGICTEKKKGRKQTGTRNGALNFLTKGWRQRFNEST